MMQIMMICGLGMYLDGCFFVGNNQIGFFGVYVLFDGGVNFVVVNVVYQFIDVCVLKLGSKVVIGEIFGGIILQIIIDVFLMVINI